MKSKQRNLVLGSEFGGLGDHLFLTPIPRLYKEKFPNSKVFLSSRSKFRSWEIYPLVWQNNPYLDGLIDEEIGIELKTEFIPKENHNIIQIILAKLGLDFDIEKMIPEIYNLDLLKPSAELQNYELIDMNYISYVGAMREKYVSDILNKVIKKNSYIINPKTWIKNKYPDLNIIKTKSLLHYASLIYYSNKFFVLPSGGSHLALVLGSNTTVFYGYRLNAIFLNTENNNVQISQTNLLNLILSEYQQQKNLLRYDKNNQYVKEPFIFKILLVIFLKIFKKFIFQLKNFFLK